ncbi:putative porin [Dyadobacter sp. CY345]|uniref:putative porin n=1 Tax=Dyadobacter sp. CY345 TaxID=2909335 RepID=UPI001F33C389|nr:putative porin [Dyadobacter sp. CY345]MCF2443202.1 putative porin [Dyadobacter sp. CY345]
MAQVQLPGGVRMPTGGGSGGAQGGKGGGVVLDDSTKTIYGPKTTLHFFESDIINNRDSVRYRVDTLLPDFNRWTPVDRSYGKIVDLGNTATATRNLFFTPRQDVGAQLGMRAYDPYAIQLEDVQYIDTKSQYTDLTFRSGGRKTTLGSFGYSQNVNSRFNFGIRGARLTSNKQYGAYTGVVSEALLGQNWTFLLQGHYFSKDKKYLILANYRYLNQKAREQGGVIPDTLENGDGIWSYDGAARISDDANSWERRNAFHIYQQYKLANGFQVFAQTDYQSTINRYSDYQIERGVEKGIYPAPRYNPDTTRQDIFFKLFDNKVGIKGTFSGFNYRAYIRQRLYGMRAFAQSPNTVGTVSTAYRTGLKFDNIVGLWLSYYLKDSVQHLTAEGEHILGRDFRLKGELDTKWAKVGYQTIFTSPDLLAQNYIGNHFDWQNNFKLTGTNTIYGFLPLRARKILFTPEVQYNLVDNYVYYDTASLPRQFSGAFSILRIGATFNIPLGQWTFSGMGYYTGNSNSDVIRMPKYFASGQVTYDFTYAKVLFLQVGVSAMYRSSYFADAYMPITQQFHLQNTFLVDQYTVADVFANVRIKRIRLSFKMAHVNQGFGAPGYYQTPGYLGLRRAFSFGVNWPLFD